METTPKRMEKILKDRFQPERLEIRDDSVRHSGHPGAAAGGGHFEVVIVSAAFAGKTLVDQHRMVYAALGEMMGRDIHALALKTAPPKA